MAAGSGTIPTKEFVAVEEQEEQIWRLLSDQLTQITFLSRSGRNNLHAKIQELNELPKPSYLKYCNVVVVQNLRLALLISRLDSHL